MKLVSTVSKKFLQGGSLLAMLWLWHKVILLVVRVVEHKDYIQRCPDTHRGTGFNLGFPHATFNLPTLPTHITSLALSFKINELSFIEVILHYNIR